MVAIQSWRSLLSGLTQFTPENSVLLDGLLVVVLLVSSTGQVSRAAFLPRARPDPHQGQALHRLDASSATRARLANEPQPPITR